MGVIEFYKDRSIFVTGCSGFMGKVLLEKILRVIPTFKKVYVLIRNKKGKSPQERIDEMLSKHPFDFLHIDPGQFKKVVAIPGDITEEGLGISPEDRQILIDEVSVVMHFAASIRFDLTLKMALKYNVISTINVMKLSMEMKNIVSVIHLSTCFCNVDVDYMEEKVYPIKGRDPYKLISIIENLDEKLLNKIEKSLISPHPNTYTFTKRLAELVVNDMGDKIPVAIVRPSIVLPAYDEPTPGWIDNLNGPSGIFLAAGKGVLKCILADIDLAPQAIPVDVAINGVILCSWFRSTQNTQEVPVFNATNGDLYNVKWRYVIETYRKLSVEYPLKKILWYPDGITTTNVLVYKVMAFLFHLLPAYFIDFLLIMFLQKPFLVNIQKRVSMGIELISFFALRNFVFKNDISLISMNIVEPDDLKIFYTNNVTYDVANYLKNAFFGGRTYALKGEEVDGKFRWKVQLYFFWVLHRATEGFLLYWCTKQILNLIGCGYLLTMSYWIN